MFDSFTKLGTWKFELAQDNVLMDEVCLSICELPPGSSFSILDVQNYIRVDYRTIFHENMEQLLNTRERFQFLCPITTEGGSEKWIRLTGDILKEEDEIVVIAGGTIQDVTSQYLRTHRLGKYWDALDHSKMLTISDINGVISYVNDKLCSLTGYSKEEVIGKSHRIFNSGHHPKGYFEEMWKTVLSGKIWEGDILNKNKFGKLTWVHTNIIPIKDDLGKIVEFISFRENITEQKIAEQQRSEQEKSKAVTEFGGQILHEIMTPVTVVKSYVDRLEDSLKSGDTEKSLEIIQSVKRSTERISEVFQDMRDLLNDRSSLEKIDITEAVQKAYHLSHLKVEEENVSLSIEGGEEPLWAWGNLGQLQQVIGNLINNSVYEIKDKPEKWIKIQVLNLEDHAIIKVIDSGPGIPRDIQSKIFSSLFSTKKDDGGTGFGLSISKRIIKKMGGEIYVDSTHENTCFIIKIPLISQD